MNTAVVTRSPRTGYAYLDEALDPPATVLAFAHRGGAYHPEIEGLENTMAAFRHAVALGYRNLETDVHVTRDGVLLAFHDTVLDRVTDRTGEIAGLTHAQVDEAIIGGDEHVPTLAELFDTFPGSRFNIDLKASGAVAPLAEFIAAREAWDRVLVGSFSPVGSARSGASPRAGWPRRPTPWKRRCSAACRAAGWPDCSRGAGPLRCRCRTSGARWWSSRRGSYDAPTPPACTCTSGPSTTPTRCTRCSTVVSTG